MGRIRTRCSCLQSIYRQTWRNTEVVVIDDGSKDGSQDRIARSLKHCPFPSQFIARENHGAAETINEAISLANGDYLNVVNSDDRIVPGRIERMIHAIDGTESDWGFSGVEIIDENGRIAPRILGSMAEGLASMSSNTRSAPTVGFALLRTNASISTGNLFIRKAFLEEIGGFSSLRYHHDWEFVLRAGLSSEGIFVPELLYEYRLHEKNTTLEMGTAARDEGNRMLGAHIRSLMDQNPRANEFATTYLNWGDDLLYFLVEIGFEGFLPSEQIQRMAHGIRSGPEGPP